MDGRARDVVKWSLLATLVAGTIVVLSAAGNQSPLVSLVSPGADGPSAVAVRHDFPTANLPPGTGHDGQQSYAIARQPLDPLAAAEHLDRPRYRLQRIAYPLAAWALHPSGGPNLVVAMFAVGLISVFFGCWATGTLASARGAPAWSAAIFAAVPGNLVALRISTADAMALAFAAAAVALAERDRPWLAVASATVAVLAKEPVLVVLVAYALVRRDRRGLLVAAVPFLVGATWAVWLRLTVPASSPQVIEFTPPFVGISQAARHWLNGQQPLAPTLLVLAAVLVALALWRRRDRFTWLMAGLPMLTIVVLSADATGLWANASRVTAPAMLFALIALVSRTGSREPTERASAPEPVAAEAQGGAMVGRSI